MGTSSKISCCEDGLESFDWGLTTRGDLQR
jgi:hypothetical protein